MEYGAIGAVAGMAAGGLAMYEGQKIRKFSSLTEIKPSISLRPRS
jgi:hypothetical protein